MNSPSFLPTDQAMGFITILTNLLVMGLFLARAFHRHQVERSLGLVMILFSLPVGVIATSNLLNSRPWWLVALPVPLILFNGLELILDYILKSNFRQTRWLIPYLVLFYTALISLLGYVFATGREIGRPLVFGALGTYLLSLLATWYSYQKVGHGRIPYA